MEKGPFSLYDFMGYFFPGALALYLIILSQDNISFYFDKDFFKESQRPFIELPLYMILFYIIIAYCLGHFLSFFSTLTIEKYTRIVYDDPSKLLLSDEIFVPNHNKSLFVNKWRIVLFFLIWPLILFDLLMVKYLKYNHTYLNFIEQPYKELIKRRINDVFKEVGYNNDIFQNPKNNFHKLLIHYNYEFTKYHGHKLMNYVSLYGFLRVITLISCLFFNYVFLSALTNYYIDISWEGLVKFLTILFCLISIITLTYVFYLGYLKFYRRYTMENLMLILIINQKSR